MASDTSSATLKSTDPLLATSPVQPAPSSPTVERAMAPTSDANPWLSLTQTMSVQKRHEVSVSKTSADAEKSKSRLRKRVKKREEEKEKAKEDATVDISMSDVLNSSLAEVEDKPPTQARREEALPTMAVDGQDEDSDLPSETEEQERALQWKARGRRKDVRAFEQRDLVARAFAGDNVVQVCAVCEVPG